MAATDQATGQGTRGFLVTALVALAAATAAAFGRVFAGSGPSARLVAAAAIALLLAAALARRNLFLSLAASAAGLFWILALFVYPQTLWWGLPSLDTFDALRAVMRHVGEDAIREVAPAPALDSLMTASLVAVWTAATASHALAVRSHSAILALLPPAALVGFADVVVKDGARPGYAVAFLLAAIGVLFGSGLARLEVWGPLIPWIGAARRRLSAMGGGTGRWARRLALGAAAVAVVVPGVLPGFGGRPFLNVRPRPERVSVTPVVEIRPALLRNPEATLFRVEAEHPAYWRMLSLDRFTGEVWTASDLEATGGELVSGTAELTSVVPPGGLELVQDYEIRDLSVPWLPAAFEPSSVTVEGTQAGSSLLHDDESEMLVREIETYPGYRYRVVSRIPRPEPEALDTAFENRILTGYQRYLQLPEALPPRIETLADQIAGNAPTPYRRILAIQNYLRTFTYDEKAPQGHGTSHILNFLEDTQRGFCEQFAGTMAVLVRSLGYPARVAVGFLPGEEDGAGRWVVTTDDTHAWVEVLFPGQGWLAFEPTPRGDNAVRPLYLHPGGGSAAQDPAAIRTDQFEEGPGGSGQSGQQEFSPPQAPGRPVATPAARPERPDPWLRLFLGLLAVGAVAAVGIPAGKALARRLAIRRAPTPGARVEAAWRAFEVGATDLGMGRRPGETVAEYGARLRSEVSFSDGHLERMTGAAGRAFYARDGIGPGDADDAGRTVTPLLRDLGRHAGPVRRAVGAVRPSWPG
jgi:TgpA N-terminal domain/Transglutaminase-like superfamily